MTESIFAAEAGDVFTRYQVTLQFTDWVMGGIPQNPELIEAWLRKRLLESDDENLRLMLIRTLQDLEVEVPENATKEDIIEASKAIAVTRNGNTFRRDENGLFLASYQPKALLKEATNIVFPGGNGGNKWGKTGKAPRSFLAERVFVDDRNIYLGRQVPDGTHMQVGHVDGPRGKKSTLSYYDYCNQPTVTFFVSSFEDCIEPKQWRKIFTLAERLGLGAMRSLGYGQFKTIVFKHA